MIDPIQKAVDDYIEMEAKALAWDLLRIRAATASTTPITGLALVTVMDNLIKEQRKEEKKRNE